MEDVFRELDKEGKGYLTKQEFFALCQSISDESQLETVFTKIDSDKDGRISERDFVQCYEELLSEKNELGEGLEMEETIADDSSSSVAVKKKKPKKGALVWSQSQSINDLMEEFVCLFSLKSQEQLCELYQQLYEAGQTDTLSKFEDVVVSITKDVRQQQYENERLERSYKREKDEHARHLRQLEEEMETQMQKVETRVRKKKKVPTATLR